MKNKKRSHWSRIVRTTLQETIVINENGTYKKVNILQAVIKRLASQALSGDPVAMRQLLKLLSLDCVEKEYSKPEKLRSTKEFVRVIREIYGLDDVDDNPISAPEPGKDTEDPPLTDE